MSTTITGIVANGVIVPSSLLPEGAEVEIQLKSNYPETPQTVTARLTSSELKTAARTAPGDPGSRRGNG